MTKTGPQICLIVYVLCSNMTMQFQKEVSQIANNRFSHVILQGGLSVNLKPPNINM